MSDNGSLDIKQCWREISGELFCRCRYRKIPRTCPYLHKNESIEEYHGRMKNNSNYGNFETAKQQWQRWRLQTNSDKDEDTSEEQDGEFYAYVNDDNKK